MRVGRRCAPLAELLDEHRATCAAFITAWNPEGALVGHELNQTAQTLLEQETSATDDYVRGEGRDVGNWPPEPSILIPGISRAKAKAVGRSFRQNAIIWAGGNAVPELILLMPRGVPRAGSAFTWRAGGL